MADNNRNLLSSQARVQVPWIKVTIGDYTFGVFSRTKETTKNSAGFYTAYNVQYPNYIRSLDVIKINGQVNKYTLNIVYPVTPTDDPNFFEKVFSSVSSTRKIVFSYGDATQPTYVYKDEEALIIKVDPSFSFGNGGEMSAIINYTVTAISSANLCKSGSYTFIESRDRKPSDIIKELFKNKTYGLQDIFTGMSLNNLDALIEGGDKEVHIDAKVNISVLDYINYLVSCMVPGSSTLQGTSNELYVLTLHDDTTYDKLYNDTVSLGGPYFRVTKTSLKTEHADAYTIDLGYNTSAIVTNFSVEQNEGYSILYDYQTKLHPQQYKRILNNRGQWEDAFAPAISAKDNSANVTETDNITWWTKITKYPIKATLTIQGLLRPAQLMTFVRLNVIFPGGHRHIHSGLYIVTQQRDTIDERGYKTTLSLTRIAGDNDSWGVM